MAVFLNTHLSIVVSHFTHVCTYAPGIGLLKIRYIFEIAAVFVPLLPTWLSLETSYFVQLVSIPGVWSYDLFSICTFCTFSIHFHCMLQHTYCTTTSSCWQYLYVIFICHWCQVKDDDDIGRRHTTGNSWLHNLLAIYAKCANKIFISCYYFPLGHENTEAELTLKYFWFTDIMLHKVIT